jgi:NADH-quinone oxidoreductase subunit E
LIKNLTPEVCLEIDKLLAKYPANQRQSAVISALMLVQTLNKGSLTTELMDLIAEYIRMPKVAVYEVASFYSMFDLQPVGKHKICVCTNISCMLNGSEAVVEYLQDKLGIMLGQTTPDRRFTLKSVECLAACGGAPMMQIGDQYYENLSREKLDTILAGLD